MRRRTLLVGVAAAAALSGAGAVQAAPATVAFADVVPTFGAGPVSTITLPAYGADGMHVVDYAHHGTVPVELELRNTGVLPLSVTSVDLPATVAPMLALETTAGLPLSLLPGERGTVRGTLTLDNCKYSHERQAEIRETLDVGFSVLGSTGRSSVDLDRPVVVRSPMIVGCPDRKLNRQADNRRDLTNAG